MVLGVIPARGGSKRFPRKNLAPFRGKPLFEWTVIEALKSKYLDQVTLSSEDPEILSAACFIKGLNVIPRPGKLATDDTSSESVLRHVVTVVDYNEFGCVVLLQPTSPLRTAEDIDACIEISTTRDKPVVSYCNGKKNGAVYVASKEWIMAHSFTEWHIRYPMPEERSLDIDYKEDMDAGLSGHRPPRH